ncbi:hypothetical protein BXZ70DRAFT_454075 [Cristinia sonorae]|uniref:CCHC-type domain-containing protein n=1 Tax=Cristinia sonorae TaxID=1940300 RepID=A0A8K0UHD3_9AGAR|nr:hypothetical protein BXZ70DRAFT_454075 [Cristinia sonorae]
MSPEVIDLTSSPAPEYIVIDSDGDDNSSVIRLPKQKAKRQHSKSSLLDRMTGAHGERLRENSGEISNSGGDAKPKRRKKKKKKVAVVVDGAPEVEDENEEGEVKSDEVGNGREGKGNDEEEVGEIPQAVPSLLDRLSGVERPPKPTSAKRKNSDPGHGAEPTSERSSKKRKRKESGKENDGDSGGQKPRSPSPERKREGPSSSTAEELFFVDLTPAEIPVTVKIPMNSTRPSTQTSGSAAVEEVVQKLLLPAHVSLLENVNGVEPVEISDPTPQDTDEESYIDYLDYGDNDLKGLGPRYFEDPEEHAEGSESKRRLVCKKCGVEGQHVARDCHVIICLTCGVRDEHPTRNCPISKVCFTCGMKGHTRNNCPNRYRHNSVSKYDDCDRCGSSIHQAKECPTLWRMYEYVDDRQRQKILSSREEKANLAIGEGGEGYIGRDEWCYNCGESGHLGDVSVGQ